MSKTITTIICCVAFAVGGYFISTSNYDIEYAKTATAAETPPVIMQYPKDLLLGHTNNTGLITVHDTIRDTVPLEVRHDTVTVVRYKTKYKTRWRKRKEHVPDTCPAEAKMDIDTLYVSKPSIIVPVVKEEAKDTTNLSVQ